MHPCGIISARYDWTWTGRIRGRRVYRRVMNCLVVDVLMWMFHWLVEESNSSGGLLIFFQSMRLGGLVWHPGVSLSWQDKIGRPEGGILSSSIFFALINIQRYWILSMGFWCFFAMWCCFSTDSSLCTVTPLDFSITSRCKVESGFALPNAHFHVGKWWGSWIQHLEWHRCKNWLCILCKRWVGHGITVNLANLSTKGFDCGAHFKGCLSSVSTFQVEVSSHGSPKVGLRDRIHWSVRTVKQSDCSGFSFFW